jgi:hypothetical protein
MNTPDLAPKNGDFVAYVEELQRRQLRSSVSPVSIGGMASMIKTPALSTIPALATGAAALAANAGAVKSLPIGLFAIGLGLLLIGTLFNGWVILVFLGIVALWQALRVLVRTLRAATQTEKVQAAQSVANPFAAHAQSKKPPVK